MEYPYFNNHPGMDPSDSRFQGNIPSYPTTLEVDDDSELEYPGDYHNSQRYPYRESYHGFPDHFLSPSSSITSSHPDNIWSESGSRGMSSRTAPEVDYPPVPAGPRCIFYWKGCPFRASEHDRWVEHIYYEHFKPEDPARDIHKLYLGHTPRSWTCRFRHCGAVMVNDDRKALWDAKLAHLFGHFSMDQGWPEEVEEDITWLNYYREMGFCSERDVYGGISAPPPKRPYTQPAMVFRKNPKKGRTAARGYSEQDALGESVVPFTQQMPPAQYPVQYITQYPPPVQLYGYQPPMGPEQFAPQPPPPGPYHHGY
ncbi:hypothetical protein TWF730_010651 [Orbilia blumenaviensis]|uniref:C2H2-type domain-containing protein n=1 Tax=Orbilia blumenaviensis TaxID=1796055 RepID=A0AAV9UPN9_9PEZI